LQWHLNSLGPTSPNNPRAYVCVLERMVNRASSHHALGSDLSGYCRIRSFYSTSYPLLWGTVIIETPPLVPMERPSILPSFSQHVTIFSQHATIFSQYVTIFRQCVTTFKHFTIFSQHVIIFRQHFTIFSGTSQHSGNMSKYSPNLSQYSAKMSQYSAKTSKY
jgi:hypothetical protein